MSLYNVERPRSLDEVVGQETAVSQVRGILASGNVPNVSLFVGPRGCGKTTVARIMAKAINCEHPTENGPCNRCQNCLDIDTENSIDFIEMDGASHNKVEDVQGIIKGAGFVPTSKYRVYLIDEVHMLSNAAFNALLKLLEEPPEYCRFILCTTEVHKIPATILSRCRRFQFSKMDVETISEHLAKVCEKHSVPFEDGALELIAKASDGCMRDALSVIEPFFDEGEVKVERVASLLGYSSNEEVFNLLNAVVSGDGTKAIGVYRAVRGKGNSAKELVKASVEALTAAIAYLYTQDAGQIVGTDEYRDNVTKLADTMDVNRVSEVIGELSNVYSSTSYGDDTLVEAKLITLCGSQGALVDALKRISELEIKCQCLEDTLYGMDIPQVAEAEVKTGSEPVQTESVMEEASAEIASEPVSVPIAEDSDCPFALEEDPDVLPGTITDKDVVGEISLGDILSDTVEESAPAEESNVEQFPTAENNPTSNDGSDLFSAWASLF